MLKYLKQILLNYSSPQHYYLKKSIKNFSKRFNSLSCLIDIGCGNSPFTDMFSYKNLVLVDVEKKGNIDLISDVQSLCIKNNSADLVLLTEVLEHVNDENRALEEIYRILRIGGSLILSVPFLFGIHESIDFRRWTKEGLLKVLKENNYKVIDFYYRGGIFTVLLCHWRNMPKDLFGGNFRSILAKLLYPLIVVHFLICVVLTPLAIFLDKLDKKKLSTIGYAILCQKIG